MSITQDIGVRGVSRARESWFLLMEVSIKGSLVATNFMDMGSTSTKKQDMTIQFVQLCCIVFGTFVHSCACESKPFYFHF